MKLTSGLAAVALAATTLAASPATAAPLPTSSTAERAVDAGARWLTGQLTDGLVYNDQYGGFNDYGLSADVAFALQAVGKDAAASGITDAIEPNSSAWVDGYAPGRVYAGSLAKLVSLVEATGKDATDFDGADQVSRLESLVSSTAPRVGRLEDAGVDPTDEYDADFVNVIGQSFAARALTAVASERAADATDYLLEQQCNDGFFRAQLTSDKDAADQGCVDGTDKGSVDSTALTVINILDTPGATTRARGAAQLGAAWLRSQQAADGSFSAGAAEGYNANTTGLAGWALALAGDTGAAGRAAAWLRGVQSADLAPCATTLSADHGGLAYTPSILATARTTGIAPAARDQYRRATAQALPALSHLPAAAGTPAVSVPDTAVEKSTITATVNGLGAGEAACLSIGSQAKPVTGTGSPLTVSFTLPAGAATHTFTLATLAGTTTASTVATLAPATPATPATPASPVAPTEPVAAKVKINKVEKVRNNRFKIALVCRDAAPCAGKVTVRTATKVAVDGLKRKKVVRVSEKRYSLVAGSRKQVSLKLTKTARGLVAEGRLKVKAVTARGGDRVVTTFWLTSARG